MAGARPVVIGALFVVGTIALAGVRLVTGPVSEPVTGVSFGALGGGAAPGTGATCTGGDSALVARERAQYDSTLVLAGNVHAAPEGGPRSARLTSADSCVVDSSGATNGRRPPMPR